MKARSSLDGIVKFVIGLVIVIGVIGASTGCNTVEGVGEDIDATGEAIQDAANDD